MPHTGLHRVTNDFAVFIGVAPSGCGFKQQPRYFGFIEQVDCHQLP
jgi:hypothetical protein